MTECNILCCCWETCWTDGIRKGGVNRPLAATGFGTEREQVGHNDVYCVGVEGTREQTHHCADIFAVFAIPLLFRSHDRAGVHNVAFTYEWQDGNSGHLISHRELNHAAILGTDRFRPDKDAQRIQESA